MSEEQREDRETLLSNPNLSATAGFFPPMTWQEVNLDLTAPNRFQAAQTVNLSAGIYAGQMFLPNVAASGALNTFVLNGSGEPTPVTVPVERYQEAINLWMATCGERDALKNEVEQLRAQNAALEKYRPQLCCQCHTAHNLIEDDISDSVGKPVRFCVPCWQRFEAESWVIHEKEQ